MSHIVDISCNNLNESYEFKKVAKQADGAVWYKQGKAVLLATVTVDNSSSSEDFLPLTVQYLEKTYAAAKIPGGFIKREAKPSDFETLTSRIIDRALRPLFPKGFSNEVVINVTVFSSDSNVDLQVAALHAANAALLVSSLPINKSIAAIRVAKLNNEVTLNPTLKELDNSTLDLLVVGSKNDIAMIEMRAISSSKDGKHCVNELGKDELVDILKDTTKAIEGASSEYLNKFKEFKSSNTIEINYKEVDPKLNEYIATAFKDKLTTAIENIAKSERSDALSKLLKEIEESVEENSSLEFSAQEVSDAFSKVVKQRVRAMLLSGERLDKRALNEVRDISIETNLLPSVHGSTLFTRGQTQALVTATLGDNKDAQMYELLTSSNAMNENLMVHYNFPPYSVGEARSIGAPSRRELGHGNLAKRALEPTVILEQNQTVRLVSEILESNGSSSMATVCGGSLALFSADVNVAKLTSGIAMGVVVEDNENYAILTDIMGAEDHYGDMDLKVAGTKDGITAMQLDIKLDGLDLNILSQALEQASVGLEHILNLMQDAKEKIVPSGALPSLLSFEVKSSAIPVIIGKGGSTIREIIEKFNVSIDLNRDLGLVKLSGDDDATLEVAKEYILELVSKDTKSIPKYEIGKVYSGKIVRSVEFGYFIQMPDGYDALLHNSKIPNNIQGTLNEGDSIEVKVMSQKDKRVELTIA
jgi:polyribonucleotide nucleotidyltransferase